jgi:DNA-binding SARP family transcriptional activator
VAGLERPRLLARLDRLLDARLGMVIAPAGAGKTTILAQWAAHAPADVAWYRADSADGTATAVVQHLGSALSMVSPGHPPARDLQGLLAAIERHESPLVLVVDDFHTVEHTHVGHLLQRLLLTGSGHLRLLVGSRRQPGFNLARTEVPTVLLSEEELRFRAAETAALFRDVYHRPLAKATTDQLTRQTEGWAAGLHLFHLSLPARRASDRRIQVSGSEMRYARTYLDSQVLGGIPEHLVEFLRRVSCFERLTADRCDDLLDTRSSRQLLVDLEQRTGMVRTDDGGRSYRIHSVLRRHLETELLDTMNGPMAKQHYRTAATLLRFEQDHTGAIRVLTRVGDWEGASDLLRRHGPAILDAPTGWVDWVPEWVVAGDPWLLLARARWRLDGGDLVQAARDASRAAASTGDDRLRFPAERTRDVARMWSATGQLPEQTAGPGAAHSDDALRSGTWCDRVRDALASDPRRAGDPTTAQTSTQSSTQTGTRSSTRSSLGPDDRPSEELIGREVQQLGAGIAHALSGDLIRARRVLRRCAHLLDAERPLTIARLALAVVSVDGGVSVEALLADETLTDHPWLAKLAQALASAHHFVAHPSDLDPRMLIEEIEDCDLTADSWGALALSAVRAVTLLRTGRPDEAALEDLVGRSHALGSTTLEAWARAALALTSATVGLPDAGRDAQSAEAFARAAGVPGALALAYAALAFTAVDGGAELIALAEATADDAGLDLRPWEWVDPPEAAAPVPPLVAAQPTSRPPLVLSPREAPPVSVRCFGRFGLRLRGEEPHLGRVRPRARAVLRLLALESGRPVHRELLVDALWRGLDPVAATHSLHVSVSSLRAVLEPGVPRGGSRILVRDGERYQLAMPTGSFCDLLEFDRAVTEADRHRSSGDSAAAVAALERALDLATGEVLPEDGPAEWVIGVREHYRVRVAEAAATLAELHLARHDPGAAAAAALRSLDVDPCRDASWRLLLSAYTAAGDLAAAEQARRSYADVLTSLGVVSSSAAALLPRSGLRGS